MNKIITIICITGIVILGCKNNNQGYLIKGVYKNAPDSTKLMLWINNKAVDSAMVLNNFFQFKGELNNPSKGMIISYKFREYVSLWIENTEISIEGNKGHFNKASIIGSNLNQEQRRLNNLTRTLEEEELSITKEYENTRNKIEKEILLKKSDSIRNLIEIKTQSFIASNSNSLISTYTLDVYKLKWGKKITQKLFNNLSLEMKKSEKGLLIENYLDNAIDTSIGSSFTDFSQGDTVGKLVTFSEVRKKYTLIEFWGSWCAPCRKINPNLVEIYNKYKDKGFEIVGVATETKKENWLKAIKEDRLPWINLSDVNGGENSIAVMYGVWMYPFNILIDPKGTIIAKKVSLSELEEILALKLMNN